jgi:dihydroceramidase
MTLWYILSYSVFPLFLSPPHNSSTLKSIKTDLRKPGIMVFAVGNRTRSIISARVPDPRLRRQVRKLARWGTCQFSPSPSTVTGRLTSSVNFGTGFVLWCIDNWICDSLTVTKRSIGLPWGFILELHGWWHIFTGIGAYICITFTLIPIV